MSGLPLDGPDGIRRGAPNRAIVCMDMASIATLIAEKHGGVVGQWGRSGLTGNVIEVELLFPAHIEPPKAPQTNEQLLREQSREMEPEAKPAKPDYAASMRIGLAAAFAKTVLDARWDWEKVKRLSADPIALKKLERIERLEAIVIHLAAWIDANTPAGVTRPFRDMKAMLTLRASSSGLQDLLAHTL